MFISLRSGRLVLRDEIFCNGLVPGSVTGRKTATGRHLWGPEVVTQSQPFALIMDFHPGVHPKRAPCLSMRREDQIPCVLDLLSEPAWGRQKTLNNYSAPERARRRRPGIVLKTASYPMLTHGAKLGRPPGWRSAINVNDCEGGMALKKKGRPGGSPHHLKPRGESRPGSGDAAPADRSGAADYWRPRSVLALVMYSLYLSARPAPSSSLWSCSLAFSDTGLTFSTTALANSGAASLAFLPNHSAMPR